MNYLDIKEAVVQADDPANKDVLGGRVQSKTIRLRMYGETVNATWAADKTVKRDGYPLAQVSFRANRDVFRWEVGDAFKFSYSKYSVKNMVCRVVNVQEEDLESEDVLISAVEDVEYLSNFLDVEKAVGFEDTPINFHYDELDALSHVKIVEAPYVYAEGGVKVIPVAARETGWEVGYSLLMSTDGGASYVKIVDVTVFNPYGVLVAAYPEDTYQIDDDIGFQVDFTMSILTVPQSISRSQLFTDKNLALLGDEIITFQTITQVTGNRYSISGVRRGMYDTLKQAHSAGEKFFYLGFGHHQVVQHSELTPGSTRLFKLVPYSPKASGDPSEATAVSKSLVGRAKKPYLPWNFLCCDKAFNARYPCSTTTTTSSTTTSSSTTTTV